MKAIRVIVGVALVAFAFWPGLIASRILSGVIAPALNAGPNVHVHDTIVIGGLALAGWQVYAATAAMGLGSFLMMGGGLFLAFSKSHDAEQRG